MPGTLPRKAHVLRLQVSWVRVASQRRQRTCVHNPQVTDAIALLSLQAHSVPLLVVWNDGGVVDLHDRILREELLARRATRDHNNCEGCDVLGDERGALGAQSRQGV